ncbi:uncharacterized protein [Miscanthus floridulus]|uniref:uncharacterized protein isoform X2 n=1 Tax=Miscanthus floridulus TaxID=154761 RepID=UPI00345AB441
MHHHPGEPNPCSVDAEHSTPLDLDPSVQRRLSQLSSTVPHRPQAVCPPTAHRRFINHNTAARSRPPPAPPPTCACLILPPLRSPGLHTHGHGRQREEEQGAPMGNCQAAEAATVVVQQPGGRVQRLYWATSAAEVMRANPGHYVALVTHRADADDEKLRSHSQQQRQGEQQHTHHGAARVTRVKLLKPRDTLVLGQAYRLITVAEVTKALQAKEEEKTRRAQQQLLQQVVQTKHAGGRTGSGDDSQPQQVADGSLDQEKDGQRSSSSSAAHSGARHRHWRPSLHSIAEVSS